MADVGKEVEEELVNYEESDDDEVDTGAAADAGETKDADGEKEKKGHYVGIHVSGFRDFFLKPQLLRAIVDCGFEHPSEVQHHCIPDAMLGRDALCQAKAGMGKTAVFVLTSLHLLNPNGKVQVLVVANVRELAFQIGHEFNRFSKYLPDVKTAVLYGGVPIKAHEELLETTPPDIVVGTPGRLLALIRRKKLDLSHVKHFILDECDKMLQEIDMRKDVQKIFMETPSEKQVMMFSATLPKETRTICKRFMHNPTEIFVDDESKLTLHGLRQYYVKLKPEEKNRKLNELLDALEFNQVVIFVSKVVRAKELNKLLHECNFPSVVIYGGRGLSQEDRIARYKEFKQFRTRILVSTDIFARGIDIERVNIVINYDFPADADTYLHRVGRAGRFGTKGMAISFVSTEDDVAILEEVQKRCEVNIAEMPETIDVNDYMS